MAEFDSAGFSAVNEFFNESSENRGKEKQVAEKVLHQNPTSKRQGVGLIKSPAAQNRKEQLIKRVLKVGTKRIRDDLEEELLHEVVQEGNDDDDEEEAGRTGIAHKERPAVVDTVGRTGIAHKERPVVPVVGDTVHKKSSKKLGKKEREKSKKVDDDENKNEGGDSKIHISSSQELDATNEEETADNGNNDDDGSKRNVKKRRKVRSKQKNIRKDTRSVQEKPKHLVPGRLIYEGRPMTAETRSKLSLPPSKLKTHHQHHFDQSTTTSNNTEVGLKLAVDDLLDGSKDKPNPRKKKKSKYKNL
jgi:hypothetical protein